MFYLFKDICFVGKCGISLNIEWPEPLDPAQQSHVDAAEKLRQCKMGWFANPIFGNGDYPAVMKQQVEKKCKELGLTESSLPNFTEEEMKLNQGKLHSAVCVIPEYS